MIVFDFSKAFDRVYHRSLLNKIHHYGIRNRTHKWIFSFFTNRTQQVLVDGQTSEEIPVLIGVPQWSVIGPLLFLLYINDLLNSIQSTTKLFADDCILYRHINAETDQIILQKDLERLED